jgi:hypothetical protein
MLTRCGNAYQGGTEGHEGGNAHSGKHYLPDQLRRTKAWS